MKPIRLQPLWGLDMVKIKGDRTKTFVFPVFHNWKIKVVACEDINAALLRCKYTKDMPEPDSTAALTVHVNDEGLSYIFIPHNVSLGTTAHEVYHAVENMLKNHDVEPRGEIVAYHLGYLVQQISDWRWDLK
jgi:hypothetical protein